MTRPLGVEQPLVEPGSAAWLATMSASKIAAVLGLSLYESRFSLWHRMAGLIPGQAETDVMRRGHYLEPAVRAWFADQHTEDLIVRVSGTWLADGRPWQAASPDGLIHRLPGKNPVALLECKTVASSEDEAQWGEPGTDQIPVGYRAQVMWQMDTVGVDVCHVAVLGAYLEFREYVVHYDQAEAQFMRAEALAFMGTLPGGANPTRPPIDGHAETYRAVRQLHPGIEQVDVELDADLARQYCTAKHALKAAKAADQHATSLVADAVGDGRRARFLDQTIAQRQAKGAGVPYLVAGRNLPNFTDQEADAA